MKAYRETINRGGSRTVGPKPKGLPAPAGIAGDGEAGSGDARASSETAMTESGKRRGKAVAGGEG